MVRNDYIRALLVEQPMNPVVKHPEQPSDGRQKAAATQAKLCHRVQSRTLHIVHACRCQPPRGGGPGRLATQYMASSRCPSTSESITGNTPWHRK